MAPTELHYLGTVFFGPFDFGETVLPEKAGTVQSDLPYLPHLFCYGELGDLRPDRFFRYGKLFCDPVCIPGRKRLDLLP